MNVSDTKPVRRFPAITMVMPVSIPMTSVSYQLLSGLKAFTNPYLHQVARKRVRIFFNSQLLAPRWFVFGVRQINDANGARCVAIF